ncbi:sugar ABC transporter permease [uncultured Trichococcus sp.]|uniref:carbohydrate ABC transporter permease n=1 Tax=uncultured Trichococcus sp. TaxID=189665 RepID=UPI002A18CEC4|nr:sugar ABC transporter permease [uncultured Trichococcus sp.]
MENQLSHSKQKVKKKSLLEPLIGGNSYFMFLIPSLILFIFTIGYPFLSGLHISFTNWDGISLDYEFVGMKNFISVFSDPNIVKVLKNTFFFAIVYTILNNVLALFIANALKEKFAGQQLLRTLFFIPMSLSPVLAAFLWGFIDRTIIPNILGTQSTLGNPKLVLFGVMVIALWNGLGSNIMIYLAGLMNIPQDYYEAAEIDGASSISRFRHITLPLLGPSFTMCITLTLTSALREFATVMAATSGGPAGSSETLAIFIYQNLFSYQKAGYGQAISIIFMIVLMFIGVSMSRFFRSREVEL